MPRVLYVDDDPFAREIAEVTLRQISGLDVVLAKDGTQALALAANGGFDLIVLDLVMPDLDGSTILRALRGRTATRGIPVAIITARALGKEHQDMLDMGATAVLAKPILPSGLQREIKSLLKL